MSDDPTLPSELKAILSPDRILKTMLKLAWTWVAAFLSRAFVLNGFAAVVAVLVYFILRQEDSWRGEIAALIAFFVNAAVAVFIAFQTALLATVIRAIESMGLGSMIFDCLISMTVGKPVETPSDARAISSASDGLTSEQLRQTMTEQATGLMSKLGVSPRVPAPARWLSLKVFRIATWGVVSVVMHFASEQSADGPRRFSMDFIRDSIGPRIDTLLADEVRANVNQNVRWLFGFVMGASLGGAMVSKWLWP